MHKLDSPYPNALFPLPGWSALLLAGALVATGGCLFECEDESVEVRLSATMQEGSNETQVPYIGGVAPTNLPGAEGDYSAIKAILTGGDYESDLTVVFDLIPENDNVGPFIAFRIAGPFSPGAIIPIQDVGPSGGWGIVGGQPRRAGINVESYDGDFVTTSASGTLEVLEVSPLSFRVDAEVNGGAIRVHGDMSFFLEVEDVACE